MFKFIMKFFKKNKPTVEDKRIVGSWESNVFPERAIVSMQTIRFFLLNKDVLMTADDLNKLHPQFLTLDSRAQVRVFLEFWIAAWLYSGMQVDEVVNAAMLESLKDQVMQHKLLFRGGNVPTPLFLSIKKGHHLNKIPQIISRVQRYTADLY